MPKAKANKAKTEIEEDGNTSSPKPINNNSDEEDHSFASHSKNTRKELKKRKKTKEEVKSSVVEVYGDKEKKKNKKKKKENEKVNDKEEEDGINLPGQKHPRPNTRDPLRIFLETLYQQLPDNELAMTWMLEWGLLPLDEAMKIYERKHRESQEKEASTMKKTGKISSNITKKRKFRENGSDDDIILPNNKKMKQKQKVSSS